MKINIALTLAVFLISLGFTGCNASPKAGNTASNKVAAGNSAAPASGDDTVTMVECGVTLTLPPGFAQEKDDNEILITSPDDGITIMLSASDDGDYESAREDAAEDLDEYIADVKIVEEDAAKKINGFDARTYNGTGKAKDGGKDVNWATTIITTDKKALLVTAYAEKESLETHKAEVAELINSLKKI